MMLNVFQNAKNYIRYSCNRGGKLPLQPLLSEVAFVDFVLQITCPGTRHLNDRNMLFLSVCILGQTKRTKSVFASFPLALNERMYFERVRTIN